MASCDQSAKCDRSDEESDDAVCHILFEGDSSDDENDEELRARLRRDLKLCWDTERSTEHTQSHNYDSKSYWDARYATLEDGETFDWFLLDFQRLEVYLRRFVTASDKLLEIGCGNSRLAEIAPCGNCTNGNLI